MSTEARGRREEATFPLALAGRGRPVRLAGVDGGRSLTHRLTSMGLTPGAVVEVVSHSLGGPMIVAVNQTRIMLGRGMANRIRVREA